MNDRIQTIASCLGIPREISSQAAVMTSFGCGCLFIENHKGIVEYTDTSIKIRAKPAKIHITGKRLTIDFYSGEEIKITGIIEEIGFYQ